MQHREHLVFSLLLICIAPAISQPALDQNDFLSGESYLMSHWGVIEGLPSMDAWPILQSRDGYVWIGTGLGLARFDGVRFVTFNRKNTPEFKVDDVKTLFEDREGRIWIGLFSGGVLTYSQGKFNAPPSCGPISNDAIQEIFADSSGGIYLCTRSGLFRVHGDSGSFVPGLPEIPNLGLTFPNGDVYVLGSTVVRLATGQPPMAIASLPIGETCRHADYQKPDTLFVATSAGVRRLKFDRSGRLETTSLLAKDGVNRIIHDAQGRFFLATTSLGVLQFDGTRYFEPRGFSALRGAARHIHSLMMDHEGGIWATTAAGVFRFFQSFFTVLGEEAGLTKSYTWLVHLAKDGTLWAGVGSEGAYEIRNSTIRLLRQKDGLPDNHLSELFEDSRGRIWFGGANGGIAVYDNGTFQRRDRLPGYRGGRVLSIAEDSRQRIWVGTRGGVQRLEGDHFINQPHRKMIPPSVRSIIPCPNGDVWCVASGHVFRIRDDSAKSFIDRNDNSYLGALSILVDSDRVWYGTYGGGLFLIRGDSVISLNSVTEELGPRCLAIHEDSDGYLWINAERELQRVKKSEILNALDRPGIPVRVDIFDHRDGLINIEFNNSSANSSQLLPDGRLLFASTSGIVVVNPETANRPTSPPPIIIERIEADGVSYNPVNGVELPAGTYRVDIWYTALRFQTPGRLKFRHQLAGIDKDWIESDGMKRSLTYANPGYGDFEFRVAASAMDGPWSSTPGTLTFSIAPYFYQRWPFRVGLFVLALFFLFVGHRVRTRRILLRNRMLEEEITLRKQVEEQLTSSLQEKTVMLKEIHHRVKNNMQVISSLMSLQLGASKEPMIQEALQESQARIRSMALVHESLYQSENLATIDFREYLNRLIRQLSMAHQKPNVTITVQGSELVLSLDQAIPAGLLINELVTNTLKHAFPGGQPGKVDVSAWRRDGNEVEIRVSDNGIGLPPDTDITQANTLGLKLLVALSAQLDGTYDVAGKPGTTITVRFPAG